jgi:hypothetical protein
MGRMRVTIAGSMGLVALAAVGMAALTNPTRLAASLVFSLDLIVFVAAGFAAFCLRGRGRTVCGGFAACGTIYLLLSLGPWSEEWSARHLATTAIIDLAYSELYPGPHVVRYAPDFIGKITAHDFWMHPDAGVQALWPLSLYVSPVPYTIHRVAHSLFGLGAGMAGGLFALVLTRKTNTSPPDHP